MAFLIDMQIVNMTKANKTLLKSDAHIRISFTMSIEQQAGLLQVIQAQQIQIAAYAVRMVL